MPTQRYKLTIAYRGTHYHGWQHQSYTPNYGGPKPPEGRGIPTIQEIVSRAVTEVVRHPIELVGSSRTDAGVHAKGQIAHFDTHQMAIPAHDLRRAINYALPADIVVRNIEAVDDSFHAILSAVNKRYQYAVWNHVDRNPFYADLAWHRWRPLDVDAMRDAASKIVGEHDFATFCRPHHKREHTVRVVRSCDISRRGPLLVIGVEGNGFLWNMVRIIAGTLVQIGAGQYTPSDIDTMLAAKDRRAGGMTAPPEGLYLQWIHTSPHLKI